MFSPPMKLVDIQGETGIIDTGEDRYPIHLHFLDSAHVGDYLFVHLRFAIQKVDRNIPPTRSLPSETELRATIERMLGGKDFTVLLTSGAQVESLHSESTKYKLPPNLLFVYGPGCPVCITPMGYYRNVFQLAQNKNVILVTFSDVMNMPTPEGTLHSLRMLGSDIRVVHSPYDVLRIVDWNPDKEVILAPVGFDSMAAAVGITLQEAERRGINNLSIFSSLQRKSEFLREYFLRTERKIDGVLSSPQDIAVEGLDLYKFINDEFKSACVCCGATTREVLAGILETIRQKQTKDLKIDFTRQCQCLKKGNPRIRKVISEMFSLEGTQWILHEYVKQSKYILRDEFKRFDATEKFVVDRDDMIAMPGCHGREIQLGMQLPNECPMFATKCKPDSPVGPGMLSYEGLCNTWYHSSYRFTLPRDI